MLRALYFPIVIFRSLLPDAADCLPRAFSAGAQRAVLHGLFPVAIAFTVLQLYWGWLIIQQIAKMLRAPEASDEEEEEEEEEEDGDEVEMVAK